MLRIFDVPRYINTVSWMVSSYLCRLNFLRYSEQLFINTRNTNVIYSAVSLVCRISELRSTHQCENHHWRLSNDLYTPFTFLVFNVGDLTGRLLSSKIPLPTSTHSSSSSSRKNMSTKLVVGALFRGIFFLLFLLCVTSSDGGNDSDNTQTHPQHSLLFKIHSDFYSFVVQFLFALTNGLLISYSFMYASNQVQHTTDMQERSSEMLTFAIGFGLLSGSLLSFPFTNLASRW